MHCASQNIANLVLLSTQMAFGLFTFTAAGMLCEVDDNFNKLSTPD